MLRLNDSDLRFLIETVATDRRDYGHIVNLIRDKDDLLQATESHMGSGQLSSVACQKRASSSAYSERPNCRLTAEIGITPPFVKIVR
jgi:hypothetical protein